MELTQHVVIEKYDFAISISLFMYFHEIWFSQFRKYCPVWSFRESVIKHFFDDNFDFRFSANTQMDNDVTPVYLAAQVSRA